MKLAPYQQRMLAEQSELAQRVADLARFLANHEHAGLAVEPAELERMRRQLAAMEQYNAVLLERIEAWGA